MTPQERQQFRQMQQQLATLMQANDPMFVENMRRRLGTDKRIDELKLGDLKDVDDTGITNGQLLKYNSTSTRYEPANDIDT